MVPDQNPNPTSVSRIGVAVTVGIVFVMAALLIPAVNAARESARRTQSRNNLKQLGLALHNYHDTFDVLPSGGVFDADGIAFHEWTTMISPYLDASSWYNGVDFRIPWDDPRQVDLFRDSNHRQARVCRNPSLPDPVRPDGLISNHYAGNQALFFRNSSVSLKQLDGSSERLLVADAFGQFLPVGAPFGWRDVTPGLGEIPSGFGCTARDVTQCLMADGAVREILGRGDQQVLQRMAGPVNERPAEAQVRRIAEYPLLDARSIWKVEFHWTDAGGNADDGRGIELRKTPPAGHTEMRQP